MYLAFTILILLDVSWQVQCSCRHSYVTSCDDINDLAVENVETWTDLVIGDVNSPAYKLREVNYDSFNLDLFEKLVSLTVIRQINGIKTNTFDIEPDMSKLEYIKLYGNDLKRMRTITFAATSLKKLSLVNNSIEYIHEGVFYNCWIKSIDLSHNRLESVENKVFTEEFLENETTEIVLRNNRIEFIADGSFPSSLQILHLDYNILKEITAGSFANLVNLIELTVSHNQLTAIAGMSKWMEILIIDASYNKITSFNAADFNNLRRLEVLDLSHNHITRPSILEGFNFTKRGVALQISLAYNRLTHIVIGNDTFRNHIAALYGNPWDCKCWTSLERFMVENKVKRNKCDLKLFGAGEIPYCINYEQNYCNSTSDKEELTDSDITDFGNIVAKTESVVNCRLHLRTL